VRTPAELLALHDDQIRAGIARRLPPRWAPSWDGPVLRAAPPAGPGFAFAHDLAGLDEPGLDALIARTRDYFAARGQAFEWKAYGHDRADLADRLRRSGFAPEEVETVLVGRSTDLAGAGQAPDGVRIRATTDDADLRRIAAMESAVWGVDWSRLAGDLREHIDAAPDDVVVLVAEAGDEVVSAAWLVPATGTDFGVLRGGTTTAAWRRRGIYRALVERRARSAADRGVPYLMVEASADSRPILERVGMVAVTTTTPWVWSPEPSTST
jgi:hypothetical protein